MKAAHQPYVSRSKKFSNHFLKEVLPDNSWEGEDCFIIGGGPSLKRFNWALLKGKKTIGVNRAYEKHDPSIIFSMDTRFVRYILEGNYGLEAKGKFLNSKAYRTWLCTYICKLPSNIFIVPVYINYSRGFKAFPLTMKDGIGHGNNSGYGAINLAVCLGVKRIYLLGFDMKVNKAETHWHNGHYEGKKRIWMKQSVLEGFKQYFNHAANEIKRKTAVEVINLNPESGLDCFPKQDYNEILY